MNDAGTGSPPADIPDTIDASKTAPTRPTPDRASPVSISRTAGSRRRSGRPDVAPQADPAHEPGSPAPHRKKRSGPIRILEPDVVPISDEDYQQAITALATMIAQWWERNKDQP